MNDSYAAMVSSQHVERSSSGRDFILVLLLLLSCGNPLINYYIGKYVYVLLLGLIVIFFRPRFSFADKRSLILWLGFLAVIFVGQLIVLRYISYLACLNYMAKLVIGYSAAVFLGRRFKEVFLAVMTMICVISLVCFVLEIAGVHFHSLLPSTQTGSIGIYSFLPLSEYSNYRHRNCGMFWEPGAFAGYINVAFMLFINNLRKLTKEHKWEVIILTLALLTTFSTTGYICFALIVFYYVLNSETNGAVKIASFAVLFSVAVLAYSKLDFLGEKVESQLQVASELTYDAAEHSRFASMATDWFYISRHPVFGNGFVLQTRYAYHLQYYDEEDLIGFGNGFTGIVGTLGIPFMLLYLYTYCKNRTLKKRFLFLLFVVLILQGEQFMNFPLFLALPFVNYGE